MTQEKLAQPSMYCRQCGYALVGLSEDRCPECGRPFDPADRRTFFRHPRSYSRRRWLKRIVLAVTMAVLLVAIFVAACFGWVYWQYHADWQAEQEALAALKAAAGPRAFDGHIISQPGSGLLYRLTARLGYLGDRVQQISLTGPPQSELNLAHLAAFKHCRSLALWGAGITDDQLKYVEGLTDLSELHLLQNPAITDSSLVHLKGLTSLEILDLRQTSITGAGLRHLQGMACLRELLLGDTPIQGGHLAPLETFRLLQFLSLNGSLVTDADLIHLKGLPLKTLLLGQTGISNAGLADLGALANLVDLDLSATAITDAGLEHLTGLANLRELYLNDTVVTDAGLKHLERLPKLERLYVRGTKVTPEGIRKLKETLPSLTIESP